MTFASLALLGVGTVLAWAAVTGENPVTAARDVLTGTDSGGERLRAPTGGERAAELERFAPLRDARTGGTTVRAPVPSGRLP